MQTASLLRMKDRGVDTVNDKCIGSGWLVSIKKKKIPRLDLEGQRDPPEVMR